jgi:hypothetical protein
MIALQNMTRTIPAPQENYEAIPIIMDSFAAVLRVASMFGFA